MNRLREPSTWSGLGVMATGLGMLLGLSPEAAGGLGSIFGGVAVLLRERSRRP